MKIQIGDIFSSHCQALVNTVNCVGVMGKGIALEFKKRYPEMFAEYENLCRNNAVKPGLPYFYKDLNGTILLNFPTKDHWRSPSKLSYILSGLDWFCANYQSNNITSIAFPPLGCGNGGLTWDIVGPVMYSKLHDLPIEIEIYAPYGTDPIKLTEKFLQQNSIESTKDVVGVHREKLEKNWLLILYAVQKLNKDRYSLSVGRTIFQKVCYVITRAGVDTGFHFVRGSYGPYAKELKNAIAILSNANYMTERKLGRMVETVVSPSFCLNREDYSPDDIKKTDHAIDLLSRIKSTDHAEVITTVLFSYDELKKIDLEVTDNSILEYILSWKPRWKGEKEQVIQKTILNLSILGWIKPTFKRIPLTEGF